MEDKVIEADAQDNTESGSEVSESWLDGLSDDLKGNDTLKGVESVESLAKEFVDLKSNQPTIPETPEGYEFDLPETIPVDEQTFSGFKKLAHDLKIPVDTAKKLVEYQAELNSEFQAKLADDIKREMETTESSLKKAWGDDFQKNMDTANKAAKHFFSDDIAEYLGDSGFGRNQAFIEGMLEIGKMISEHELIKGDLKPPKDVKKMDDGRPMFDFKMERGGQ